MLSGCIGSEAKHHYLFGVWKSNEEMTLDSMNKAEGLTEKARELLENDFFGILLLNIARKRPEQLMRKMTSIQDSFLTRC
jgi:hypothetical protein